MTPTPPHPEPQRASKGLGLEDSLYIVTGAELFDLVEITKTLPVEAAIEINRMVTIISTRDCASHSTTQSERDTVLADIGSFLRVEACKSKTIAIQKIVEYIEELHTTEAPR